MFCTMPFIPSRSEFYYETHLSEIAFAFLLTFALNTLLGEYLDGVNSTLNFLRIYLKVILLYCFNLV